jgi:hypothetical protein
MLDFFKSVLPDTGYYCIGILNPKGGFQHRWFEDKEKAYSFAMYQDSKGETVYFGQAGFKEPTNRKGENAESFRTFFLDIDCGSGKPFSTQADGVKALKAFYEALSMPMPTVVNSGTGLYAYWTINEDVPADKWLAIAQLLKRVCAAMQFEVDPVRTADRSSVLRPVGATNRKKGGERTVKTVVVAPAISIQEFAKPLLQASHKHKIPAKTFEAPPTQLNAEFQLEMSGEKPSAHKIADRCAQVGQMRTTKGNIPEPQWYAIIGLLKSTIEAPEIIHEWSTGHAEYSREATEKKIEQHKVRASTCHYLHSVNPDGCVGCSHHGKINSPWRLGLPDPKPVEIPAEEVKDIQIFLPAGFARTDKGIIYTDGEGDVLNVFPYDIYPVKLTQDDSLGQEIMALRAKDPHTGWFNVSLRTALLHDPKQLLMTLSDQGVHSYFGKNEKGMFMQLLAGYLQQLKDQRRKVVLSQQMGWHEEHDGTLAFVLGDRLISKRGVEEVGIAKQADSVVKAITKNGDLTKWSEATRILDKEGLEPWAFTLAALGFGAPLMRFTGYKGSMLSMVGKSGLGKTAMGWWALSVWGNSEKLQMIQRDTQNATVARMSLYNNLPLFIDEITNIDQKILSDMAYQITQGRDKHTLTRGRTERPALPWATIGGASSNKSLVDILGGYKSDPSAEINRIFEYEFPSGVVFDGVTAYTTVMANYGLAGEVFAKYLVDHQDEHAERLRTIQTGIEKQANCKPEERFWAITAACALYGAAIASKLGLFHVDLARLSKWVFKTIEKMRGVKDDTVVDSPSWIGTFLSKYSANMMVVRAVGKDKHGKSIYEPVVKPHGPLYIRKDMDTDTVWISRDLLKRELLIGSASYSKLKQELVASRALTADNKRVVLGHGTEYAGIAEICWVLDLNNPTMGYTKAQLVREGGEDSAVLLQRG